VSEAATASDTGIAQPQLVRGLDTIYCPNTSTRLYIYRASFGWPTARDADRRQAPESDGPDRSRQRTDCADLPARGQCADKAITDAIDPHVLGEQTKRGDDGADVSRSSRANGPA
jgi:hypothetical protein